MGLYVRRMKHRVSDLQATTSDSRPIAPPASGPTEQVTLYVAYDDPGTIRATAAQIPLPSGRQQRAEELLRALMNLYLDRSSAHPLPPGAEIRSVYLIDPGVAVIDTNAAFADGHRSGVLVEELTVASLIQTLSANIPGITRIRILVDGKQRETLAGHADLSDFYEVSAVRQLVQELQAAQ
jgi:spore germination protein GerM